MLMVEKSIRWLSLFAASFGLLAACEEANPRRCDSDSLCQQTTWEYYDATKPYCHAVGHYCFTGCDSNAYCTDSSKPLYDAKKTRCDLTTHQCVAGPTNLAVGQACAASTECANGNCADGVCCGVASCGVCQACNVPGKEGTCQTVPAGENPRGMCTGDKGCGGDVCGVNGECTAFALNSTACSLGCVDGEGGVYGLRESKCDGAGKCSASSATVKSCAPFKCGVAEGQTACLSACATANDCTPDSLCDRFDAHLTGQGLCAAPNQIVAVGDYAHTIQTALQLAQSQSKAYVKVPAGTYAENVTVSSGSIKIVGVGEVVVKGAQDNVPVVNINEAPSVGLQNVKIEGGLGAKGIGVKCNTSTNSQLTLVENKIENNAAEGIFSTFCDVTLRRNMISGNKGGGVNLNFSAFTIDNNLVYGNGNQGVVGSEFGGFKLSKKGQVIFVNNTVVGNIALGNNTAAGVICDNDSITLSNSIIWGNGELQYGLCSITNSDVQGGVLNDVPANGNINADPLLDENYKPKTNSPVIDAGKSSLSSLFGKLDNANQTRQLGNAVDLGAFEVK